MIYHTCPKCGANLDPGEFCDCDKEDRDDTYITKTERKEVFYEQNRN